MWCTLGCNFISTATTAKQCTSMCILCHARIGRTNCFASSSFSSSSSTNYIQTHEMTQLRLARTQSCDFTIWQNPLLSEKGAPEAHCCLAFLITVSTTGPCRQNNFHRIYRRVGFPNLLLNLQNVDKTVQRLTSSERTHRILTRIKNRTAHISMLSP